MQTCVLLPKYGPPQLRNTKPQSGVIPWRSALEVNKSSRECCHKQATVAWRITIPVGKLGVI